MSLELQEKESGHKILITCSKKHKHIQMEFVKLNALYIN